MAGATWLAIAGQLLWLDWAQTADRLGDTDDAMRLVQVREFLAGRDWFELHEPRLQPPLGYDTHWSRLIDAGLASLYLLLRGFADSELAERLMRAAWPLLWIGPAMAGALAIAWRLGSRAASLVLLLLLLFGVPAFVQFRPGRIDHHDVQITLALLTMAAAMWADRLRWASWVAGILSGLALAIGVESLPLIALAGAAFAARYALDRGHAAELLRYGLSTAISTAVAFVISVPPGRWTETACDAIAVNLAAPAILGGIALVGAGYMAQGRWLPRCMTVAAAIALAALAFIAIEPRCLRGPLALVDPAVLPIWLAHVREAQSVLATLRANLALGFGVLAYPAAAAVAALVLAREQPLRRDPALALAALAFLVSAAMTMVAVRAVSYAIWFGMPLIAAALLRLFDGLKLATLPARVLTALPFTPAVLSFGTIALAESAGLGAQPAAPGDACLETRHYAALAKLPSGLMVADVDYGPFLLALTPHSALAAPYHRMSYGIVTSHRVFASPPAEAREILRKAGASYVMFCQKQTHKPRGPNVEKPARSLRSEIEAGHIPEWLERLPQTAPFAVFRFKP